MARPRPGDDRSAAVARHREGQAVQSGRQDQGRARGGLREAQAWLKPDTTRSAAVLPDSRWTVPALPELLAAVQADFNDPDKYPVDARGVTYTFAFVGIKRLGAGQFYLVSLRG